MEIMEDRHARHSNLIASQLPVAGWFDIIGEATIADAILDRLVHTCLCRRTAGALRIELNLKVKV